MKTELIASWKIVNSEGRELYLVTTVTGQSVWVPKAQFDSNAEQITYKSLKAGDTFIGKDKVEGTLIKDRNEFVGCGKQIVKKYNSMEIMDHMIAKGVTPTFALS